VKLKLALGILCTLVLLILPFISGYNKFIMLFTSSMLIFIAYSSAWNLLAYSGQGSLGHAAFLGIGGYTSAVLSINYGLPPLFTVLMGGIAGAGVGLFVGALCVRLREWFLAMVTFGIPIIMTSLTVTAISPIEGDGAIAKIVNSIIIRLSSVQSLLGGHDGLFPPRLLSKETTIRISEFLSRTTGYEIPRKIISSLADYYVMLIFAIITVTSIHFIIRSKWGFAFAAIRENELEAKSLGVNTVKYKLIAFVLSALISGIAGGLMVHHIRYINPSIYEISNSFDPIIYSVIGGLGTIEGPIIGTAVISILNEYLKRLGFTYLKNVLIGTLIVFTILFMPKGLTSLIETQSRRKVIERIRGVARWG
jgi:branched-chain amino acid transport system permease protein